MPKKTPAELKKSKPFYIFDLIVYAGVAAVVAVIFLAVFYFNGNTATAGFNFYVNNQLAAEYFFESDAFAVKSGFEENFSLSEEGVIYYANGNVTQYNIIIIDKASKTARVREANCVGHDCLSHTVSEKGGFIYCAPHNLKITPMVLTDPVTGQTVKERL